MSGDNLRKLIADWRRFAKVCASKRDAEPYNLCADELEAALSSAGGGEAVAYAARAVASWLDDGSLDTSRLPGSMGSDLRNLRAELDKARAGYTAPTPQAQGERDGAVLELFEAAKDARYALYGTGAGNRNPRLDAAIAAIAAQQPKGAGQ